MKVNMKVNILVKLFLMALVAREEKEKRAYESKK